MSQNSNESGENTNTQENLSNSEETNNLNTSDETQVPEENNVENSTNFLISCLYNAITEYYSDSELMFKGEFR